jgi:hypothetical protein
MERAAEMNIKRLAFAIAARTGAKVIPTGTRSFKLFKVRCQWKNKHWLIQYTGPTIYHERFGKDVAYRETFAGVGKSLPEAFRDLATSFFWAWPGRKEHLLFWRVANSLDV